MKLDRRQLLASILSGAATLSAGAASAAPWSPRRRREGSRPDAAALLEAVSRGDLERVRGLLAGDPGLARAVDGIGRSAFVLASVGGRLEIAGLLRATLRASGADLDIVEAVLARDWERFGALCDADPALANALHPVGGTPLYAAALVGEVDLWRLRARGCEPDRAPPGGSGYTPARGAMESARAAWARIALADLCANGADVDAPQRGGSTVLHGAVERRDATLVRLAVRKGADVAALDEGGRTARALAGELAWEGGVELLAGHAALPRDHRASRFALDANREPVRRPDLSDVPRSLQSAVTGSSHMDLARVRELAASDPRLVFSISTDDELAIEACAHTGARDIIRFHLDHGAPLSLPTAVSLGDLDAVAFWLERDPRLVDERGAHDFPLMWYVVLGGGSTEMAELLLHYGVGVDQESVGTTALHWAALRDDADVAAWLIDHGADLEAVGHSWERDGQTPLEVALSRGCPRVASLLKDRGARR